MSGGIRNSTVAVQSSRRCRDHGNQEADARRTAGKAHQREPPAGTIHVENGCLLHPGECFGAARAERRELREVMTLPD